MTLSPHRLHKRTTTTMPAKSKPKTTAVKKHAPLVLRGTVAGTLHVTSLCDILLASHTSKELADLLRNRGLKIHKDKAEMAHRLATWAWATHDRFTLTLGA